jgi:hypothetical protein
MKRTAAILTTLLFILVVFSACKTTGANPPQTEPEVPDDIVTISMPGFFNDIGKTLNTLKNEYPGAEIFIRNDGFPDAAAACFGEPEGNYIYTFFGGQDGNFEDVMEGYGNQLKCAGFLTTAGVLFPEMEDDMSFSDFFPLIGVSDYKYFSEEGGGQGYLKFKYNNMDVWLDTNEFFTDGSREFTGVEKVKRSAPVIITDEEIFQQNQELADSVMFD